MSNSINTVRVMRRTLIAWASCIVVVIGVVWAEAVLYPRSHRVLVPFLVAGVSYVIFGRYVRHRWGDWALATACAFAIALCTLLVAPVFLDVLDLGHSLNHPLRLPTVLALSSSAWALVPVGILLQRSARRPQPLLNWDLPVGLIVCVLGELVGFALDVGYMVLTSGAAPG